MSQMVSFPVGDVVCTIIAKGNRLMVTWWPAMPDPISEMEKDQYLAGQARFIRSLGRDPLMVIVE